MNRFLVKIILSTLPLVFFLCIPFYILWVTKENFHSLDKIAVDKGGKIIGYAYNENNYGSIKWATINERKRFTIWALGSSTVLQFREQMFDVPFYNAGKSISSIYDFRQFLKSVPKGKHPKYLLIGLNQMFFNSFSDGSKDFHPPEYWGNSFSFYPSKSTYLNVWKDLVLGNIPCLFYKGNVSYVGLNANKFQAGFRSDGSVFYKNQISKLIQNDSSANDYGYKNTMDRIRTGNRLFQYCDSVDLKALQELSKLLQYCKENEIKVMAFLPPFADKVYAEMMVSNKYKYLNLLYSQLYPVFKKYHYEVYDFSTVSLCKSSDDETIDGFHGGEVTYLKLLIQMLDSNSILTEIVAVGRLRLDLEKRVNNYLVYPQ